MMSQAFNFINTGIQYLAEYVPPDISSLVQILCKYNTPVLCTRNLKLEVVKIPKPGALIA